MMIKSKAYIFLIMICSFISADQCNDMTACNYNSNSSSNHDCIYPYECPDNSFECDINDCLEPNGFEWNQSSKILFLFVDYAFKYNSNFHLIEYEDWIGGFKNYDETQSGDCETISNTCPDINSDGLLTDNVEVCVGSKYWNGINNSEIPLMGFQSNNTLTNGYLEPGDIPYFKLFDSVNDSIYFMVPYKDGAPYEVQFSGNSSIEIMRIDSLVSQCPFYNSYDSDNDTIPDTCDACPNDSNNDIDNDNICFPVDTCPYDYNNDVDGDGICACTLDDSFLCEQIILDDPLVDLFDTCPQDSDNDIDGDGVCGNLDQCPNDFNNLDIDLDGICDIEDECVGSYDDCNVCNGQNNDKDCNGDCFGEAYLDDCNVCVGGNTLFEENHFKDCNGDCFGNAYFDDCDVCSEGQTSHEPNIDKDCFGECFGTAVIDDCDVCDGQNIDKDCSGTCFGELEIDDCGVCGGNNYDQCDYDEDGIININDICPNDPNNDIDGDSICGDIDICPNDPNNDVDGDNICGDIDAFPTCYFNFFDCFGECGGEAVYDVCGICDGTGNCQCPDFEYGIIPDCNGLCGGLAVIDDCGICDGNNNDKDCSGECFGTAVIDDCGICNGNNNDKDCFGECFGTAVIDDCDICNGQNIDKDCNGDCFGEAYLDDCNICSDGDTNHVPNSDLDCSGVCFGNLTFDECGICGGSGIGDGFCDCSGNILDCSSECGGNAFIDDCGICDGNNEDKDCNGECFGNGIDIDNDNICDDIDDCIGEIDSCGICNGDGTWCLDANIYFGNINQTHLEILYDSPLDIGGFQFTLSGLNIVNAFGGVAGEHNFNIANNNNTVLGFSLTGESISSGSGVLVILTINYINTSACIQDVILSDNDGDAINVIFDNCIEIECSDTDADTICNEADDCFGTVDECGVCNGDGIEEGACDCDGNVLDCNNICAGSALVDECGICGGENTDKDCNGDCFGLAFIDYCGDCVGGNTNYYEGFFDLGCGCDYPAPMNFCYDSDGDNLGNEGTNTLFCNQGSSDEYENVPENWVSDCSDICFDDIENDADGDGICESDEIFGCDDSSACNFDELSSQNDGSCIYFNFNNINPYDGSIIEVTNDSIGESILFEWEFPPSECNYGGGYRLQIYDANNSPIYFNITTQNNIEVNYLDLPFEDSVMNTFLWDVETLSEEFVSNLYTFYIDTQNLDNSYSHIPDNFFISNTYPNPFNPQTMFEYGIPQNSFVSIKIYDSNGGVVHSFGKYYQAGVYKYSWNPKNIPSGIYYIQLKSDNVIINKKTTYLK